MNRPRDDRKLVPALTDEELRALIDACRGKTLKERHDEAIAPPAHPPQQRAKVGQHPVAQASRRGSMCTLRTVYQAEPSLGTSGIVIIPWRSSPGFIAGQNIAIARAPQVS